MDTTNNVFYKNCESSQVPFLLQLWQGFYFAMWKLMITFLMFLDQMHKIEYIISINNYQPSLVS